MTNDDTTAAAAKDSSTASASVAPNRKFVEVARLELSEVTLVIYELDGAVEIQSRFGVKIDAERHASNAVRLNLRKYGPRQAAVETVDGTAEKPPNVEAHGASEAQPSPAASCAITKPRET